MLGEAITHYERHSEKLKQTPATYKREFEWLKDIDSLVLMNAHQDLERAYSNFFRNPTKFGFPNFKSKHKTKDSFRTSCVNGNIKINQRLLKIPKIDPIEIRMERQLPTDSRILNVTVSKNRSGKYFASICFEYEADIKPVKPETYIGLDYSMPNLFVSSWGEVAQNPQYYRNTQPKLAREQRKLSKMVRGSNNYNKQKIKVARLHERIANQRKDYLHKTSTAIAKLADVVCVEDLNMQNMSQALNFGKSVHDNGWGMFVGMLQYKLAEQGKYLVKADKWFPSSKQCSSCKEKKEELSLAERIYSCEHCGYETDRDLNAAYNLENFARTVI